MTHNVYNRVDLAIPRVGEKEEEELTFRVCSGDVRAISSRKVIRSKDM